MNMSMFRYFAGYFIGLCTLVTRKIENNIKRALRGELILSIYFHNPSEKMFVRIINWLESKNLNFISADQLVYILQNKIEFPKGAVFVSIDDGWGDNMNNVFSTSEGKRIPITLFSTLEPMVEHVGFWWSYIDKGRQKGINLKTKKELKKINNLERLLEVKKAKKLVKIERESINIETLKLLSQRENITIGSHTYSHPILTKCEEGELNCEIGCSKNILNKIINKEIKYFAYPNGIFKEREESMVNQFGYTAGFGTDPEFIFKGIKTNPFNIPRFEIDDDASLMENICRATGVWYSLDISSRDNA